MVYLLTSDEDVRDGRWTVAANATAVKTGNDVVSFQLDKLVRGRSVNARSLNTHSALNYVSISCWLLLWLLLHDETVQFNVLVSIYVHEPVIESLKQWAETIRFSMCK